jgi:hypothetical protein
MFKLIVIILIEGGEIGGSAVKQLNKKEIGLLFTVFLHKIASQIRLHRPKLSILRL